MGLESAEEGDDDLAGGISNHGGGIVEADEDGALDVLDDLWGALCYGAGAVLEEEAGDGAQPLVFTRESEDVGEVAAVVGEFVERLEALRGGGWVSGALRAVEGGNLRG